MLACWQTCGYFNVFSNNVNKKMNKKVLYKHINSAVLEAAEDKFVFGGKCGFGYR